MEAPTRRVLIVMAATEHIGYQSGTNQGGYLTTNSWVNNQQIVTYPIAFPTRKVSLTFGTSYGSDIIDMRYEDYTTNFTAYRSGSVSGCFWTAFGY